MAFRPSTRARSSGHARSPGPGLPRHLHERRRVVDVLDHLREAGARLHHAWPADDKGHVQRFFVDPTFVEPAVLAGLKTLVGRVDDDGVVR
jgi:hypothetical protein